MIAAARRLLPLSLALLAGCAPHAPLQAARGAGLHTECRGARTAAPTVILESGAFGSAADWAQVLPDLARGGRVCAYDRAGIGRSPPRDGSRDVEAIAAELKGLLDQLGERRPVILVGHSNGALYVETFAAKWPEKVAGLAYVNGVTSDDLDYPLLIDDLTTERRLAALAAFGGQIGMGGGVTGVLSGLGGFSGEAAERKRQDLSVPDALKVASDEDWAVIDGLSVTRKLGGSPPQIPTAVIGGSTDPDDPLAKAWRAAETAPALRARQRLIVTVPDSSHTSPLTRDRSYVVNAVAWLRGVAASPRL